MVMVQHQSRSWCRRDPRCKVRFRSGKWETQREFTPVRRISMFCLKEVFLAHLMLENCVQGSEL